MDYSQAGALLALDRAYTQRTVGRTDVEAWRASLEDLDYEPCRVAIVEFYKRAGANTRQLATPGIVREHVEQAEVRAEAEERKASQLKRREELEARQLEGTAANPGLVGVDPHHGARNSPGLEALHHEAMTVPCPQPPHGCGANSGHRCRNLLAARPAGEDAPHTKIPHPRRMTNAHNQENR